MVSRPKNARFNVFTGNFEFIDPENFPYNIITTNDLVIIPFNQQMPVHGVLDIIGTLIIDGEVNLEE